MTYVYKKLNQLEDCSLERNLILYGIEESDGENEDICNNKIHGAIAQLSIGIAWKRDYR